MAISVTLIGKTATSGSQATLAFSSYNQPAHSTIVVAAQLNAATNVITSITDTAGNTYKRIGIQKLGVTITFVFYATVDSIANATNVITINYSPNASFSSAFAYDVAGVDTNSPIDTVQFNSGTSTAPSVTLTTSYANEAVINFFGPAAGGYNTGSSDGSGSPPYTSDGNTGQGGDQLFSQHKIVSSTISAVAQTGTLGSSGAWVSGVITLTSASRKLKVVNVAFGGSASSLTTIPANAIATTTGNLIVVGLRLGKADMSTVTNITDTAGNTYLPLTSTLASPVATQVTQLWYAKNITGNAANVVQANLSSGSTFNGIVVWEISGADITTPLDQQAAGSAASGTTSTSGAFTTTVADEIICAVASFPIIGATFTPQIAYLLDSPATTSGFPDGGTNGYCAAEHDVVNAIQTGVTTAMTCNSSGSNGISVATFKAATGSGGGTISNATATIIIPLTNILQQLSKI